MSRRGSIVAAGARMGIAIPHGVLASLLAPPLFVPVAAQAQSETGQHIAEVVVTARKREEAITDVPMSVTALQSEQLESAGIGNSEDLVGRIPALSLSGDLLSPGKDFSYFVMRGVGANTGGDPAAPVFIDGVYQPRLALDTDFVDVQRVEVLRGPQGTLFGRNTQGGAINIVSRRPEVRPRAKAVFEIDDFPGFRGLLSMAGPLSGERVLGSIAVEGAYSEGYLENRGAGRTNQGLVATQPSGSANDGRDVRTRGSLRLLPNDDLEIYVTGDYAQFNGLWGLPGVRRGCKCYETQNEFQLDATDKNYGAAVNIDWDLGDATLAAITGYRRLSTQLPFDFDGGTDRSPNFHDFRTTQKFLSQEIRLASDAPADRLRWLTGLFYFEEDVFSDRSYSLLDQDTFPAGLIVEAQDALIKRDGWAAFGQIDFDLLDQLTLTAGARYSTENADGDINLDYTIFDLLGPGDDFVLRAAETETDSFTSTTWTASLNYKFHDDASVYVTASKGFKAGGFPLTAADLTSFTSFDNETSLNYEAGVKGQFFAGRLQLEAAAFKIDLKKQQLASVILVDIPGSPDPIPVATIANTGRSSVYGGELTAAWRATDRLEFSSSAGYTNTQFDDYLDTDGVQHAGEPFRFVPEWTGNFTAEYVFPVRGGKYDISLYGSYRYVDSYREGFGVAFDPEYTIDSYDIIDASASLIAERWRLQLFVDNVADSFIETRAWNTFFFLPDGSRAFSTVYPPRRTGLRFTYNF